MVATDQPPLAGRVALIPKLMTIGPAADLRVVDPPHTVALALP
jgi:hypothetical protein